MLLILAELCGRWGCSWQEGILTVIVASFKGKGVLMLMLLVVLLFLQGLLQAYRFIDALGRNKQEQQSSNLDKSQQRGKRILQAVKFAVRHRKIIANK